MKKAFKLIATLIFAAAAMIYPAKLANAETCFFQYEQISGLNKICHYSCTSGGYAITVSATTICPIHIQK